MIQFLGCPLSGKFVPHFSMVFKICTKFSRHQILLYQIVSAPKFPPSCSLPQCHSCLAICAFVLFINRPTVISDGRVCCCLNKGSDLTVVTDLGGPRQAQFAERHPHLSTDNKLWTLCVCYLKPSLFFAKPSPRTTLPATPASQSATAVTPAKRTKPMEPRQPRARKNVAKNVTVDDWRFMSHDSQIGYLLAMINGDVNKCIPSWAL